jgi:flavin reductase (DIM6/NTAB) family NADH-FMN oxidoreductase RutF
MRKRLGASPMIIPMPAVLVATYNDDGTPNAMTAAWASACCHTPPCVGVAVRDSRKTFANIRARRAFTINIASADMAAEVDALGLVSGHKDPGKLARLGLATERAAVVDAPLIERCPIAVECRLVHALPLGTHTWFVGEVVEVQADERVFGAEGVVDLDALDPLAYVTSAGEYRGIGRALGRAYRIGKAKA